MKIKNIIFCAAMCTVSLSAMAQAHITGKVNNYKGGNAAVIVYSTSGRAVSPVNISTDGSFNAEIPVSAPNKATFLLEDQKLAFVFFLEDKMNTDMQVTIIDKMVNGIPKSELLVEYGGDNKDANEFIKSDDISEHFKNWPFERIDTLPFRTYRDLIQYEYEELRGRLNLVKSVDFRRIVGKQVDAQKTSDLWRWAWTKTKRKDTDFEHWVQIFDHNDPQNMEMVENYWRWYKDRYEYPADAPAYPQYELLKKTFSNQEIINMLADGMIQATLMHAPDNMNEAMKAYLATSTNEKGHAKARELYNHYKNMTKGSQAAEFDMYDINGNKFTNKDLLGKAVYIDCWATWCGPCCGEIPYMEKLYEHYKNNKKIELVSISIDQNQKAWEKKVRADKPKWRQFICPDNYQSKFYRNYNISAIPRFLMLDKKGNIISLDAPRPSDKRIIEWIDNNLK